MLFFFIGWKFWGFGHRFIIGRSSVDYRPIVGRQSADSIVKISRSNSADCRAIICRLSADNRPTIGRQSADDLFIGRSSPDCRPTELIAGRRSADGHKPRPHIHIAFMYTYLDIFAFSFGGKRLSTNHQFHHFYKMRMRTEAKMSYDYLMRRPIVARLIVCCPTCKCCRPTVGRSSDDDWPIVRRRSADRRPTHCMLPHR